LTQYPLATKPGFSAKHLLGILLVLAAILAAIYWFTRPVETPLTRAQALIRAGKAAAALPLLEQFSIQHPDNSAVFPWLAQGYLNCERLGEGRTALDTALRLKLSGDAVVPVVLAYANFYESKGDFEEAEGLFNSAQAALPAQDLMEGRAKLYLAWADADSKEGRQEEAVKHLAPALELTPGLSEPLKSMVPHKLAETYRELAAVAETKRKNDQEAIDLLKKSLSASDEPVTRMSLANIYSRQGQIDQAIDCYKKVKDSDPNNLESRHRLVDLLLQKKDFVSAQEALLELTDKERSVENYQLLASVDEKLNNQAGAVKALEDARKLRPKDLVLLKDLERILLNWAVLLAKQGRVQESISARGHGARITEMIALLDKKEEMKEEEEKNGQVDETASDQGKSQVPKWDPRVPPIALTSSKIWLAKGSLTPEGEIAIKNICGLPVTDLSLTAVFYDNTRKTRNGSITLPVCGPSSPPFQPGTTRSLYFSCPNTVKADHQLAVIIFWRGRLLKELPVVKQR
jgi:tetratricopeptide (TPR) repeat protein